MPRNIEIYCLGLISEIFGEKYLPQHTFDYLRGDPTKTYPPGKKLPVDGYFPNRKIAVEIREAQHYSNEKKFDFWNKRITATGITRKEQRLRYDQRREEMLPKHGVNLLIIKDYELSMVKQKDIEMLKVKINSILSSARK